jgi:hypothetical protein
MSDESSEEDATDRRLPRFVKNSLDDIDTNAIYINTSSCQYPIFKQVADKLGWIVDSCSDSENWDIFWTDSAIES